jgi:hypothetical protein
MKTCFGLLAAGLTLLTVASTTPETAYARGAKGPKPKSDFTISTLEVIDWGWIDGEWKMSGDVSDSGTLWGSYGLPSEVYGEYNDYVWLDGEFGSMKIFAYYDNTFEVVDGTGLYDEWIGSVGLWDLSRNPRDLQDGRWKRGRNFYGFLP